MFKLQVFAEGVNGQDSPGQGGPVPERAETLVVARRPDEAGVFGHHAPIGHAITHNGLESPLQRALRLSAEDRPNPFRTRVKTEDLPRQSVRIGTQARLPHRGNIGIDLYQPSPADQPLGDRHQRCAGAAGERLK